MISIIVPVYNSEAYLRECVDSVLGQDYQNLELILVDDGSKDGSLEICREYERADRRVRVIAKENGGVGSARNAGFSRMKGQWFMTVDADDYMAAGIVKKLKEAAEETGADLAMGGLELFWPDGREPERLTFGEGRWAGSLREFTGECLVPLFDAHLIHTHTNKLYRTRCFWGKESPLFYDEAMSINEDIWFSARMLARCRRVCVIPDPVVFYRQSPMGESLVSRFHENGVETCMTLLNAILRLLKRGQASPQVRNQMYNRMVFHICGFAGLCYYRSDHSLKECYEGLCRLVEYPEFARLLKAVKPEGMKNTLAVSVLRGRHVRLYHLMCLALYGRQRREFQNRRKGKTL